MNVTPLPGERPEDSLDDLEDAASLQEGLEERDQHAVEKGSGSPSHNAGVKSRDDNDVGGDLTAESEDHPRKNRRGSGRRQNAGERKLREILMADESELREEAARIAKRVGAEQASPVHVQLAAAHLRILRQPGSVLGDMGLALGSSVVGASGSYGVNLLTGGEAMPGSEPWAFAAGAVGLVILVVSATIKWVRR